jgi:hypothetical protein
MFKFMQAKNSLIVLAAVSSFLLAVICPQTFAYPKRDPVTPGFSASLGIPLAVNQTFKSDDFLLIPRAKLSYPFFAQQSSSNSSTTITPSSDDNSQALIVLLAVLLLPLGWGPTRKAVGLVNVIVGTILTVTGLGAIFGIPMILVGGVCLFI